MFIQTQTLIVTRDRVDKAECTFVENTAALAVQPEPQECSVFGRGRLQRAAHSTQERDSFEVRSIEVVVFGGYIGRLIRLRCVNICRVGRFDECRADETARGNLLNICGNRLSR